MKTTYIILQLILNAITGEPVALPTQYTSATYESYEDCDHAMSSIGPQTPVDGKVKVFTCAVEKQITRI